MRNTRARGKHENYKVCMHTVQSYSTHTHAHPRICTFSQTHNKPTIPKAAADSADSATQWLTFVDESPEPPKENRTLPGMSRNVNCRRLSLRSDTDEAVMGRRCAPSLRQGNWLEMMGYKHTSQGRRSAKRTAN